MTCTATVRTVGSGLALLVLMVLATRPGLAQVDSTQSNGALNLTVGTVGLSIGDARRTVGLRLNYRDRRIERVDGFNFTVRRPHEDADGTVNGIAAGLPLAGADRIRGIAVGGGVSVKRAFHGVAMAPIGFRSGRRLRGVAVGGVGVGAGTQSDGLLVGGLGAGAGREANGLLVGGIVAGAGGTSTGVLIGGLGVGAGDRSTGVLVGGLGAGAGGDVSGLAVSGVGAGAADDGTGVLIGGLGAGAGRRATGFFAGGIGTGAGTTLRGLGIAGLGVGAGERLIGVAVGGVGVGAAQSISGLAVGGVGVGSSNITGVSLGGVYTRIEDGHLRGMSISGLNDIRGTQHGLTIGIINYARELHGVQLGLINVVPGNPAWATVLPLINVHF